MNNEKRYKPGSQLLYVQISEKVLDIIRSRKLRPHEPVPSEGELARLFGVSRMTTKLALEALAKQGIVYRMPRRGTFLAEGMAGDAGEGELATLRPVRSIVQEGHKNKLIAIVIPNIDDFTCKIVDAVEREARKHEYELIVKVSSSAADEENCLQRLANVNKVDGIILFPRGGKIASDEVLRLKLLKFPLVIIDRVFREIEIDNVYHDHYQGSYQLTKYLIDKGHREIGYVSPPLRGTTSREERYQAYVQALLDHSIPVNINYIYLNFHIGADFSLTEGHPDLEAFIKQNPQMTAVVCVDDYLAGLLMYSALKLNVRVPEQLSIVGFSDIQLSRLLPIPLTTVRQPTEQLGQSALKLLVSRINNSKEGPLNVKINTVIVERKSVAALVPSQLQG